MQPRANKTTIQVIQWSNGYCKKRQDGSQGKPARDTVMKIKKKIYIYIERERKGKKEKGKAYTFKKQERVP